MKIEAYKFGPDNLAMLGCFMAECLSTMHPNDAQALFAAIIANLVGNIPEEHWKAMKEAAVLPCECGDPECGKTIRVLLDASDIAREQFKRIGARKHENPDEKEIQE